MKSQVYIPYSPTSGGLPYTTTIQKMSDPKERFYRHFQTEITAIQDQIEDIANLSPVNGERKDCIDTVLAAVSRLSNEVQDALDYIPAYDQRAYSQALKALTEKLNEATGKFAPKSRFQFKPRNAASAPATPAVPDARDLRQVLPSRPGPSADASTTAGSSAVAGSTVGTDSAASRENHGAAAAGEEKDETGDGLGRLPQFGAAAAAARNYNAEMAVTAATAASSADAEDPSSTVRKPSFSKAKNIAIYEHTGLHIILPASASRATSSGSLTRLERCVVDMTVPTTRVPPALSGVPFAGLAIQDARRCLLICGTVAGPVHVTGVRDSVVVVAARQVRVHECENVDLYLHCSSHPIIEDCKGMRFAPLPDVYADKSEELDKNQWDQVDDFKWLKTEPSPNWSVLPEDQRLPAEVWTKYVSGEASLSTEGILRKAGVL